MSREIHEQPRMKANARALVACTFALACLGLGYLRLIFERRLVGMARQLIEVGADESSDENSTSAWISFADQNVVWGRLPRQARVSSECCRFLGKVGSLAECTSLASAAASPSLQLSSVSYHSAATDGPFAELCYGVVDGVWAPKPELGVHSAANRDQSSSDGFQRWLRGGGEGDLYARAHVRTIAEQVDAFRAKLVWRARHGIRAFDLGQRSWGVLWVISLRSLEAKDARKAAMRRAVYLRELTLSIHMLRQNSNGTRVPTALVGDKAVCNFVRKAKYLQSEIDELIPIDSASWVDNLIDATPTLCKPFACDKAKGLLMSPFKNTLVLDSDVLVVDSNFVTDLFALLARSLTQA